MKGEIIWEMIRQRFRVMPPYNMAAKAKGNDKKATVMGSKDNYGRFDMAKGNDEKRQRRQWARKL